MRSDRLLTCIFAGLLFFIGSTLAGAVEIEYNQDGRPTKFTGLVLDDGVWMVTVSWTETAQMTYQTKERMTRLKFWGDQAGANAAAEAMRTALIDDGFVNTDITLGNIHSYIWLPVYTDGGNVIYSGVIVRLHEEELDITGGQMFFDAKYLTGGFTKFYLFGDGFED